MWPRIRQALIALASGQVLVTVGNLVLVPVYLTHWETAVYGEWLALFSLLGYVSLLDLGIGSSAINELTQMYARNDASGYRRTQHSAFAFYIGIAATGSVVLVAALWLFPLPEWLGIRSVEGADARLVALVLGMQMLWMLPVGFVYSLYRTIGSMAMSQWLGNAQMFLSFVLIGIALTAGGGPAVIAICYAVAMAAILGVTLWHLTTRFPLLMPGLTGADFSKIRYMLPAGLLFVLITLANVVVQQGTVVMVSILYGGVAVAVFATTRTLANLVRQMVTIVNAAIWADVTGLEARGELERLQTLHRVLVIGTTTIALAVGTFLWYEGAEVIRLWTRFRLQPDEALLRWFVVFVVAQTPWLASSVFTAATNQHKTLAWACIGAAILGLAGALVAMRLGGLSLAPLGLLVGEVAACYHFVIKDTCNRIGEAYVRFAGRLWAGFVLVSVMVLTVGGLAQRGVGEPGVVRWMAVGGAAGMTALLVGWFMWLGRADREWLTVRMQRIWQGSRSV